MEDQVFGEWTYRHWRPAGLRLGFLRFRRRLKRVRIEHAAFRVRVEHFGVGIGKVERAEPLDRAVARGLGKALDLRAETPGRQLVRPIERARGELANGTCGLRRCDRGRNGHEQSRPPDHLKTKRRFRHC